MTSQAGWSADTPRDLLASAVRDLREAGIRVSLFVDPSRGADPVGGRHRRRSRRAVYGAVRARIRARRRDRPPVVCHLCPGGGARPCPRSWRQRGSRPRPEQPRDVSRAAPSRRGVDRARAHQPGAVRRAGAECAGLSRRAGLMTARRVTLAVFLAVERSGRGRAGRPVRVPAWLGPDRHHSRRRRPHGRGADRGSRSACRRRPWCWCRCSDGRRTTGSRSPSGSPTRTSPRLPSICPASLLAEPGVLTSWHDCHRRDCRLSRRPRRRAARPRSAWRARRSAPAWRSWQPRPIRGSGRWR